MKEAARPLLLFVPYLKDIRDVVPALHNGGFLP